MDDDMDHRRKRSIAFYECKITVLSSLVINLTWWFSVAFLDIKFPHMQFILIFFMLAFIPQYDKRFYGNDHCTSTELTRFATNLVLFIIGMLLIGDVMGSTVPAGLPQFLWTVIAVGSIMAIARGSANLMMVFNNMIETW